MTWGLDDQRDLLATLGLTVAFVRGCWRLYAGEREVARRSTAMEMVRHIATLKPKPRSAR